MLERFPLKSNRHWLVCSTQENLHFCHCFCIELKHPLPPNFHPADKLWSKWTQLPPATSVFGHKISTFQEHKQNSNYLGCCFTLWLLRLILLKREFKWCKCSFIEPEGTTMFHCLQQIPELQLSQLHQVQIILS